MSSIYIPVGYNCDPAKTLRDRGLRKVSYPFDWCVAHPSSIVHLIKTEFNTFLGNNVIGKSNTVNWYIDKDGKTFSRTDLHYVHDIDSNLVLVHDYYKGISIEDIKEQYMRRFLRMVEDVKSTDTVNLVYYDSNPYDKFTTRHNELVVENFGYNVSERFNLSITLEHVEETFKKLNPKAVIKSISYTDI